MYQDFVLGNAISPEVIKGQVKYDHGKKENVYQANGYKNREEYLSDLACQYEVSLMEVRAIADMLGKNEDFDGLVTALEDFEEYSLFSF